MKKITLIAAISAAAMFLSFGAHANSVEQDIMMANANVSAVTQAVSQCMPGTCNSRDMKSQMEFMYSEVLTPSIEASHYDNTMIGNDILRNARVAIDKAIAYVDGLQ